MDALPPHDGTWASGIPEDHGVDTVFDPVEADSSGAALPTEATTTPLTGGRGGRKSTSGTKRRISEVGDSEDIAGTGEGETPGDGEGPSSGRKPRGRPRRHSGGPPGIDGVESTEALLSSVAGLPVSPGKAPRNKWGLRGVRYDSNKKTRPWEVKISMFGKDKSLGYFETKEEAAIVYDIHTIQHRGAAVHHKLNFPDHPRVKMELDKSHNLYLSSMAQHSAQEMEHEHSGRGGRGGESLTDLVADSVLHMEGSPAPKRARVDHTNGSGAQ